MVQLLTYKLESGGITFHTVFDASQRISLPVGGAWARISKTDKIAKKWSKISVCMFSYSAQAVVLVKA